MKLPHPGWYQEEAIRRAEEGDREVALAILEDIAGELACKRLPHRVYVRYLVKALRGAIERNESLDAALNVAKGKGRPPMLWESRPELTILPQIMNTVDKDIAIAEAVAWKRCMKKRRGKAIIAVASEICSSPKTVEAAYDKYRDIAEKIIKIKLRQDT